MDRQGLSALIPLTAIAITLAEWRFDATYPRWRSPWFWAATLAIVGLLVLVQVLRFGGSRRTPPSKPDLSATTLIRRRTERDDT